MYILNVIIIQQSVLDLINNPVFAVSFFFKQTDNVEKYYLILLFPICLLGVHMENYLNLFYSMNKKCQFLEKHFKHNCDSIVLKTYTMLLYVMY